MNRAQDRDNRARPPLAKRSGFREQLLHFAVETDADQNRVALGGERLRARGPFRTESSHYVRSGGFDVENLHGKSFANQVPDDGRTHAACADDAYGFQFVRNGGPRHFPLLGKSGAGLNASA
jgi:hypothetical protein